MRPLVLGIGFAVALAACLGPREGAERDDRFLNLGPDASYVGDATCATCHGELYASYQTHGMAQSFYALTAENAVEDFSGVAVPHESTGFVYVARRDGDRFVQEEYRREPDGTISHRLVREMDYVVGSGSAARTYLTQENGRLYELPLTWYTQPAVEGQGTTVGPASGAAGHWGFSPGYAESNGRFSRFIPERCMACHNGTSEAVPFADGKYASLADGIGCEQCHGPGSLHVDARTANPEAPDSMDVTIVNPAWLSTDLQLDVCQQCHLNGEVSVLREGETARSYRPGRPLSAHRAVFGLEGGSAGVSVISHADRMKESACFQESEAMTCVTCHDPHEGFREKGPDYFNATCRTCHEPDALQAAMPTPALATQHSLAADCFSCHMPKVTAEDAPHASFTDHKTRVVRNDEVERVGGSGQLTAYFDQDEGETTTAGIATIVYARQGGGSQAFRRGVAILEAALADAPGAGEARFVLGVARLQMGDARGALGPLREAVEMEANPERLNALAQATEQTGDLASAERHYRRALDMQPAAADVRTNLGRLLEAQSRLAEAIAEYERAIAEEAWQVEAHTLLGGALAKAGQTDRAIAALREAVTLDPSQADALTNLAALLAQRGEVARAGRLFQRAVTADPRNAAAHANLALYYLNEGRAQEAAASAQAALQIDPNQATARQVLQILSGA